MIHLRVSAGSITASISNLIVCQGDNRVPASAGDVVLGQDEIPHVLSIPAQLTPKIGVGDTDERLGPLAQVLPHTLIMQVKRRNRGSKNHQVTYIIKERWQRRRARSAVSKPL